MLELRSMVHLMTWTTPWRSFDPFCADHLQIHQLVGGIQRWVVMSCYACLVMS